MATPVLLPAHTGTALDGLPTRFEANQGQWPAGERFRARTDSYSLSLDERGATLYVAAKKRSVRFAPARGNEHPSLVGQNAMRARANYFVGNDRSKWRSGVPMYEKVRYQQVYPGVDLVYYGTDGQLEFDFLVKPGTATDGIRMQVSGADRMSLNSAGDLVIEVAGERIVQKRPVIYQVAKNGSREMVEGSFRMAAKNAVGFRIGQYDRKRELVIDPTLYYATMFGGKGNDAITGVKGTADGYLFVTGYVTADGPTTTDGAYQATVKGGTDIVVAKIDPRIAGGWSLLGMTYLGGTADDKPTALAVDATGNCFITGMTLSGDFPEVSGLQSGLGNSSGQDAFVVMVNPMMQGTTGLYVSSYLGGKDTDIGNAIAVDAQGSVYVFGTTRSEDFPVTKDTANQAVRWGAQNCFISKFTPGQTSFAYSSYFGGDATDEGRAMAVTPSGTVYVAGTTYSDQLPAVGDAFQRTRQALDVFLARMDLTQSKDSVVNYLTFFGGTGMDEVRGMALDAKLRPVITGYTASADFPTTANAYQRELKGAANAFVSVVDPSAGSNQFLVYSTYLGGSLGEVGYGVATDPAGGLYVTGYTMSGDYPTTSDALTGASSTAILAFVTKLTPGLTGTSLDFSTCVGVDGVNVGLAIDAGPDGTIYTSGYTGPSMVQLNEKTFQTTFNGGTQDGYIMIFKP